MAEDETMRIDVNCETSDDSSEIAMRSGLLRVGRQFARNDAIATTRARIVPTDDTTAQTNERLAERSEALAYSSSESSRREKAGSSSRGRGVNSGSPSVEPTSCSIHGRLESSLKSLESANRWWNWSIVIWSISIGLQAAVITLLLVTRF